MNTQQNQLPPSTPPKLTPRDRAFWLKGPGVILTTVVVGGIVAALLYIAGAAPTGAPGRNLTPVQATVTGCRADDFSATAALTVTNTDSRARTVTIDVEYRDGSGARLDTDTAYVRDIAPGDTVKHDETTILDAAPSGTVTCLITDVDSY